jgi:hypothetical protein
MTTAVFFKGNIFMTTNRIRKHEVSILKGETYYIVGEAIKYQSTDRVTFKEIKNSFPDKESYIRIFISKEEAEFYAAPKQNRGLHTIFGNTKYKCSAAIFEFIADKEISLKKFSLVQIGEEKCSFYNLRRQSLSHVSPKDAKIYFCGRERKPEDPYYFELEDASSSCCCVPM